jgi:hypothetical protein
MIDIERGFGLLNQRKESGKECREGKDGWMDDDEGVGV